jgi:hypothetical protein
MLERRFGGATLGCHLLTQGGRRVGGFAGHEA